MDQAKTDQSALDRTAMDQPAMGQPAMGQAQIAQPARKPRRRLSKGMYILPSLFTTANMALGFYAMLEVLHATLADYGHLDNAAKAIGFAVLFDGLDGRIARMTGTSSDFGKELDSLADAITFGVAPAMLAWKWGFFLMPPVLLTDWHNTWHVKLTQLERLPAFFSWSPEPAVWRGSTLPATLSPRIPAVRGRSILSACQFQPARA